MDSQTNKGAIATLSVKVNGSPVSDELRILSLQVEKKVNHVSSARIVIQDGDPDTESMEVSSSAAFVPGNTISIEVGYNGAEQMLFSGIITGQHIRVDGLVSSVLEVICFDNAVRMTVAPQYRSFNNQKDSDVVHTLISGYAGLSANVATTTIQYPQQLQYAVTDWDYIVARAVANGLMVTNTNGNIATIDPTAVTEPVIMVAYGESLITLDARLDAIDQLGNTKASAWDFQTQSVVTADASNSYTGAGNLSSKTLSEVIGLAAYELQTSAPLPAAELLQAAQAQLVKSNCAKIQGEATFQGTALAEPGKYFTLRGVGERFSGDHLISGVAHTISDGNWTTKASIGLSFKSDVPHADVKDMVVPANIQHTKGLFNGVVKQLSNDPDGQFNVLVTVPMFHENHNGIRARLSNFYATNGAGAFFFPEIGDEVVLGFLNEDLRYPVILGSMYSSSKPVPGAAPDDQNSIKAIVSKSGIALTFDETNRVLNITTPAKNTITLSDKDKQIAVRDQHQNSIVLSENGITIKSEKNINIQAGQQVVLSGEQGIKAQSTGGDIALNALNIKETAQMQYLASGNMETKISSGMQLTLKGAMVLIN